MSRPFLQNESCGRGKWGEVFEVCKLFPEWSARQVSRSLPRVRSAQFRVSLLGIEGARGGRDSLWNSAIAILVPIGSLDFLFPFVPL